LSRKFWLVAGGLVGVAALVLAGLAFGGVFSGNSKPSPSASSSSTTSSPPRPISGVKPIIRGLIDRQGPPPKSMLSFVHAYVVKVNWSDLQPTAFGPIASDNAIDKAIARVNEADYAAVGMALKLRVFAGVNAPGWVKSLGGAPVPYVNTQDNGSVAGGTIGRFWTSEFGKAYADLEAKLAAKYDTVAAIREVTVSRCSTLFDEPFVRQFGDPRNVSGLLAAGYSTAADKQCISDSITEHDVWKYTTSDVDFSPLPTITDPGAIHDLAYTTSVMAQCRAALGLRCGLENNALSESKLANPQFHDLYDAMAKLGSPIVLQTAARSRLGDPAKVLPAAVQLKANSVELPAGYAKWSKSLLAETAQGLAQNPAR
jgi:hypothetical protein